MPDHQRIIEPTHGLPRLNFQDLWQYRDFLLYVTLRDVRARYAQTILGVLWVIIQPLIQMVIYTVIFWNLAQLDS